MNGSRVTASTDANGNELEISVWDQQDPAKPKKRELILISKPKGNKPANKPPVVIYCDPANVTIPPPPKKKDDKKEEPPSTISCMGTVGSGQAADGFTITKPANKAGKVKVHFKFGTDTFDCEMDEKDADKMLGHLAIRLIVAKKQPHIEKYALSLTAPYSPVLGVKMNTLQVEASYHPPGTDRPALPSLHTSQFAGRILLIATEETLRVTFTDFVRTP